MNILEPTNAVWFVLGVYLLVILSRYSFYLLREVGWGDAAFLLPRSLLLTFTGITGTRGITYLGLNGWSWDTLLLPMAAFSVCATLGMLCLCRVLSPAKWGAFGFFAPFALAIGTFFLSAMS